MSYGSHAEVIVKRSLSPEQVTLLTAFTSDVLARVQATEAGPERMQVGSKT